MSSDAIMLGVEHDVRVEHIFRVRCDDRPSGFIEVSKTRPSGANAMTVTIRPLYGEPFTVNVDLLNQAVHAALHAHAQSGEKWYREEHWRRVQAERESEANSRAFDDEGER